MPASRGDELKTPEKAYLPDSRSLAFSLNDIADQFNRIERYELAMYLR